MNNTYNRLLNLVTEIRREFKTGRENAAAFNKAMDNAKPDPKKKTILGHIKGAFQGLIAKRDARNAKRIQTKLDAANAKFDAEN